MSPSFGRKSQATCFAGYEKQICWQNRVYLLPITENHFDAGISVVTLENFVNATEKKWSGLMTD